MPDKPYKTTETTTDKMMTELYQNMLLERSNADDNQFKDPKNLNMQTKKIIDVLDPTAAQDAATKTYVDNAITSTDARIRAWIQFNGTGTIATQDSYNVSSITDEETGDYIITWDTDFANDDYAVVGMAREGFMVGTKEDIAPLVGSIRIRVISHAGGAADQTYVFLIAIGDQ